MGKQLGVIQYSGKLGNVVGMKKGAGQTGNNVRIKSDEVKNPKTLAQIIQRMKTKAAANFYRAFKEVLNHSFQGIEYGAPSHNKFMKLAMEVPSVVPIFKGSFAPIPNTFRVSTGTAPLTNFTVRSSGIMIGISSSIENFADWGDVSQALIDTGLSDGDQITVLALNGDITGTADTELEASISRYIIDSTSSEAIPSVVTADLAAVNFNVGSKVVAGTIIVSRPSVNNGVVSWERSNSSIVLAASVFETLTSTENIEAAINSYADSSAVNPTSNWYLNGGTYINKATKNVHVAIPGGQLSQATSTNYLTYICKAGTFILVDSVGTPTKVYTGIPNGNSVEYTEVSMAATAIRALGFALVAKSTVEAYGFDLEVAEERP